MCLNKIGSICLKSCLIICPHSSRRNLAGQAVMLKKLNFTFPYLDAKVPVSKEWKIIIVSSKSHTNTRCDDRQGGKKKYSYILSNCKNFFSQEIYPLGLELFKISNPFRALTEDDLWKQAKWNIRNFGTMCVLVILRLCSPNHHRNPLLHVKTGEQNSRLVRSPKENKCTYQK